MECNIFIENYLHWLKENFQVHAVDQECLLITPFLDPGGDHIEIKVVKENNHILLTDDGAAHDFLFLNGIDLFGKSQSRKYQLDGALNNNRAFLRNENEIATLVMPGEDIGAAINRLIRAILAVEHLVYTIKGTALKTFKEEVTEFFDRNRVSYTGEYIVHGKAKEHKFDFFIPKKEKRLLIKALSTENVPYAKRLATDTAFAFLDLKEASYTFTGISLIDDTKDVWEGDSINILSNYSILLRWTRPSEILKFVA